MGCWAFSWAILGFGLELEDNFFFLVGLLYLALPVLDYKWMGGAGVYL